MGEEGGIGATKTVAQAMLEDLLKPKLGPGKACLIVIRGRSVGLLLELKKLPAVLGRAPDAELTIDDLAVSRKHAQIERGPDGFLVRDLHSTNGVFVNGVRVEAQALRDGDRIQIGTAAILKFCFQDELETDLQRKLYDSATRDSLTGLYNRGFFLETLEVDLAHAIKAGQSMSLLFLDIDRFKGVNDAHGHPTGDRVLAQSARLIQAALRVEDVAARYGGEEFAVLLRYTEAARAFAIAERVRQALADHEFVVPGGTLRLTVSIGLATLEAGSYSSVAQLIEAADQFLYRAKQQGRNQTVHAGLDAAERQTAKTLIIPVEEAFGGDPEPEARPEARNGTAAADVPEPKPKRSAGRMRRETRRIRPSTARPAGKR
jgi:two-component system, cell cycle response regulator